MFFIRKDLILHRQEHTGAIHEVDDGQMVFHRDLLQAQILFSCDREPGASLHGLVVGDDHALFATHIAHAGNGASGRTTTVFFIHAFAGERADLHEGFVFIPQVFNPLPCRELIFLVLFFDGFLSTAQAHFFPSLLQLADREFHLVFVFVEFQVHLSGYVLLGYWVIKLLGYWNND